MSSGKRACPICRKENYQKKLFAEGARHHRDASATKLQARSPSAIRGGGWRVLTRVRPTLQCVVRGWLTRVRYRRLLAEVHPRGTCCAARAAR